jgi:hypothetical protein
VPAPHGQLDHDDRRDGRIGKPVRVRRCPATVMEPPRGELISQETCPLRERPHDEAFEEEARVDTA